MAPDGSCPKERAIVDSGSRLRVVQALEFAAVVVELMAEEVLELPASDRCGCCNCRWTREPLGASASTVSCQILRSG
jgi:hypothetical protein